MKLLHATLAAAILFSPALYAGNNTLETAVGAGVGAAIGNEVGGRDGAIIGGAVGAAIGSSGQDSNRHSAPVVHYEVNEHKAEQPSGYHCPPGQAKKGRC